MLYDSSPKLFYNALQWDIFTTNGWSFGREFTNSKIVLEAWSELKNLWEAYVTIEGGPPVRDPRLLRGGPALRTDGYWGGGIDVKTDKARRVAAEAQAYSYFNDNIHSNDNYTLSLKLNPIDKLRLSTDLFFERNNLPYDYFEALSAAPIDGYLVGRLSQKTASVTLRAEYYIRPEVSFQYYGNPYFSAVHYSNFRRVDNPLAAEPARRFHTYSGAEIAYLPADNEYLVNEPGHIPASFNNPDISFGEFRSNFVFRWEYRPGSTLYFVWTHNQGNEDFINQPLLGETGRDLFASKSRDILMLKLTYWFNI
jgi:hypothetical protein